MTRTDLHATEARVFRAYWQDGLIDLLAGASVVAIGVGWIAGFVLASVVVPPIALSLWPLLRRRITEPRLGRVRFNARRRFEMRHGLIAVASLGVVLLGVFAERAWRGSHSSFVEWVAPGIPALLLAALAVSSSVALRAPRFAGYAAGFVAAALVVSALDAEPGWSILAGGVIVTVTGARLLTTFLGAFPTLPAEMDE